MLKRNIKKGLFSNYFKPSIYLRSFKDVNVNQLKRQGIKLFISDLDNTLVPHYTRLPNKDVVDFVNKIQDAGMEFIIMSNNLPSRVDMFAKKLNITEWYGNARKPFKFVIKKIMNTRDLTPSQVLIMGDQILMDIWVANRIKCESILVQPLVSTDYKMSSFNMFLEKRLYKNLEKRNILKRGDFMHGNLGGSIDLL